MNNIPSLKFLFKKLGIFTLVFIGLMLISSVKAIKDGHNRFYCSITNVIFNAINPEVIAQFSTTDRTDVRNYGIAIALYDKKKYTARQLTQLKRMKIPDTTKFPNLHALVIVPTIFLLSLFVITPIPIKSKLLKGLLALFIFYVCLVFYYSYVFSLTLNNGKFEIDSIWHFIIRLFGVDNTEYVLIFVLMIWGGLSIPQMIKLQTSKYPKKQKKK